jgi:hypothetical protein
VQAGFALPDKYSERCIKNPAGAKIFTHNDALILGKTRRSLKYDRAVIAATTNYDATIVLSAYNHSIS